MKMVIDPVKYGPAAKKVANVSRERLRNPAIKVFQNTSRQVLVRDEIDGMAGMGDWWDSITDAVSSTADKLWDQAVASGQKAATQLVTKEIMKIVGADGKVKEVPVNSPEAIAYQQQVATQQAAANAPDPMMKYAIMAMIGVGGLITIGLVYKFFIQKKG